MKGAVLWDGWGLSWRCGPVVQFGMWQPKVARWKRGCDGVMEVLGWWCWWSDDHGALLMVMCLTEKSCWPNPDVPKTPLFKNPDCSNFFFFFFKKKICLILIFERCSKSHPDQRVSSPPPECWISLKKITLHSPYSALRWPPFLQS